MDAHPAPDGPEQPPAKKAREGDPHWKTLRGCVKQLTPVDSIPALFDLERLDEYALNQVYCGSRQPYMWLGEDGHSTEIPTIGHGTHFNELASIAGAGHINATLPTDTSRLKDLEIRGCFWGPSSCDNANWYGPAAFIRPPLDPNEWTFFFIEYIEWKSKSATRLLATRKSGEEAQQAYSKLKRYQPAAFGPWKIVNGKQFFRTRMWPLTKRMYGGWEEGIDHTVEFVIDEAVLLPTLTLRWIPHGGRPRGCKRGVCNALKMGYQFCQEFIAEHREAADRLAALGICRLLHVHVLGVDCPCY